MSADLLPYLPTHTRQVVESISEQMKLDPGTVVAAVLAHDAIKKLPLSEQPKAIGVIFQLYVVAKKIEAGA